MRPSPFTPPLNSGCSGMIASSIVLRRSSFWYSRSASSLTFLAFSASSSFCFTSRFKSSTCLQSSSNSFDLAFNSSSSLPFSWLKRSVSANLSFAFCSASSASFSSLSAFNRSIFAVSKSLSFCWLSANFLANSLSASAFALRAFSRRNDLALSSRVARSNLRLASSAFSLAFSSSLTASVRFASLVGVSDTSFSKSAMRFSISWSSVFTCSKLSSAVFLSALAFSNSTSTSCLSFTVGVGRLALEFGP